MKFLLQRGGYKLCMSKKEARRNEEREKRED